VTRQGVVLARCSERLDDEHEPDMCVGDVIDGVRCPELGSRATTPRSIASGSTWRRGSVRRRDLPRRRLIAASRRVWFTW
jgi:hypothetical protein